MKKVKKPTIISINSEKGGVGKTTTAYNLAGASVKLDKKVLLIDLDTQQNLSQSFWNEDEDSNPTFAELLYNTVSSVKILNDEQIKSVIRHTSYGLDYCPCNKELLGTLALMLDKNIFAVKNTLDCDIFKNYDLIILDTKNYLGGSLVPQALAASDQTIIVTECGQYSFFGVGNTLDYIDNLKDKYDLDLKVCGVLVNKSPARLSVSEMVKDALAEGYSELIFKTMIPYRLSQTENAIRVQKPCVFYKTNTLGSFYSQLANEVMERIGG